MPELPEVETARLRFEKALKGKKIAEVYADAGDRHFFANAKAEDVKAALLGAKVTGSGRKGKYFWLKLNRHPWPLFHLGMTGNIEIRHRPGKGKHEKSWGGVKLWSEGKKSGAPEIPFFTRILIEAADGAEVALTDPRRFGRMWLTEDPERHPQIVKLGFDPLQKFPSPKELHLILKKRKAPIKAVLLDQGLFAGIGNWTADEILYQSALSPRRKASSLSLPEVSRLRKKMSAILRRAVAVEADYERFPKNWLFHFRWGKQKEAKTSTRQKIIHEEIGGRTTAWVPSVQK